VRRSRTSRTFARRADFFSVEWATLEASTMTRSDCGLGPTLAGWLALGVSFRRPRRTAGGRRGRPSLTPERDSFRMFRTFRTFRTRLLRVGVARRDGHRPSLACHSPQFTLRAAIQARALERTQPRRPVSDFAFPVSDLLFDFAVVSLIAPEAPLVRDCCTCCPLSRCSCTPLVAAVTCCCRLEF